MKSARMTLLFALGLLLLAAAPLSAQDDPALDEKQAALASRYSRFEKLLLQMSEYLGRTDPDRAELLMRALSRSREERISTRMNGIVELLRDEDFDEALDDQEQLVTNLRTLLELLQSEDRRSELEEESERLKGLLKDVNKLIGDQKIARATSARAGKPSDGMKAQQRVADEADRVVKQVKQQDADRSADGKPNADQDGKQSQNAEGQPKTGEGSKDPGEGQSKDPGEGKSEDPSKPSDGEQTPGQKPAGEGSKSQPGGESQPSQDGKDPAEQKQTPGREELQQARDAMQRAIDNLKTEQKEGSAKEQDEALEQLLAAKEKLEEKLRQLREEERELMLAALEARFQKMLAMQLVVNSSTTTLAATELEKWLERDYTRARELAQLESQIGVEASKALTVLREEGTSVSFPLAVEDVREDILTVARRLEDAKVGELTQEIQADIVEALQEMVLALQKEMEKKDDDESSPSQPSAPQNAKGDPVLVDLIAELKMLRTLQRRVNRRTRQIGRQIDGDQADSADLLEQLERLAERQERIRQTAIDIARTRRESQ